MSDNARTGVCEFVSEFIAFTLVIYKAGSWHMITQEQRVAFFVSKSKYPRLKTYHGYVKTKKFNICKYYKEANCLYVMYDARSTQIIYVRYRTGSWHRIT